MPRAFCSPTRCNSCACLRRPPSRPANWSSSSCRPTKARASSATSPAGRYRSPTCAPPSGGRGSFPPPSRPGSLRCTPSRCGPQASCWVPSACSALGRGELNEADLLVAQTLAHIACVAILQEHPPTPDIVLPRLRSRARQPRRRRAGQGFPARKPRRIGRGRLPAVADLRPRQCQHLTDVARRLISDRIARPGLLAALSDLAAAPR